MSRHLFWKSGHRKSVLPVTEEREFEKNVRKLENLEENSRKLHKNVKAYTDSNTSVNKSLRKISQDLTSSQLFQQQERLRDDMEKWDMANVKLEPHLTELNNTCQKAAVDPMKKLNAVFPAIQVLVRKREQSLQELTKCQQKFDKQMEKERTGANIVKVDACKKAVNMAREEFNQHEDLSRDMPELYTERISYIEPCVDALIKSQNTFDSECFKVYSELSTLTESKDDYSDNILQKLAQIKALSITVGD